MTAQIDRLPIHIIPRPVSLKRGKGGFSLSERTIIALDKGRFRLPELANYLSERINFYTGLSPLIADINEIDNGQDTITLNISRRKAGTDIEFYNLTVVDREILLDAYAPAGIFRGIQTLLQLIPVSEARICGTEIPAVEIQDYPSCLWRGMHLDVSRHFFPKEFIKKFIDLIVMHKMNIFHWHLTDDQGWRIEIKKHPKLTEVGAWRTEPDGSRYGGFYTQDDIREVVRYAEQNYVTVVPEIDIPGHSLAALAAYPEYSCTGGPFEVANSWGIFDDVFCPGRDETFAFLEDILGEVATLFPEPVIHIGGDECPTKRWKSHELCQARLRDLKLKDERHLMNYFVRQITQILVDYGKTIVGWDEITDCQLPEDSIIMAWRGMEHGLRALKRGHIVVMSPTSHCYFDHYQAKDGEPKAIGGFLPLEKVYEFNPTPKTISSEEASRIIGGQGNIWTEYMPDSNHVEYMALPRMCAMAEALWSPAELRDFGDFKARLRTHCSRLDLNEFWYRPLD